MARILALEPYYGGSHRAFLDGWKKHSRHELTTLTLKPHHWKWRMRHAGITLAQEASKLPFLDQFDGIWSSSMVNLAEFLGTAPSPLRRLPSVLYFHENQLFYPALHDEPRDVHFAFTHWASTCAAAEIWFNSNFNRRTLFDGLTALFQKMPDQRRTFDRQTLEARSYCLAPGIDEFSFVSRSPSASEPLRLAWAARFEHDKGPELLLHALRQFKGSNQPFRLTVMGEQFDAVPDALKEIAREFSGELDQFGFVPAREDYVRRLNEADVFISTAQHEFFGLSVMEAAAAGCSLLLPEHLSYPELFGERHNAPSLLFYDNTAAGLDKGLRKLASMPQSQRPTYETIARTYAWPVRAQALDDAMDRCLSRFGRH